MVVSFLPAEDGHSLLSNLHIVLMPHRRTATLDTRPVSSGQPPLSSTRLCPAAWRNTVYSIVSESFIFSLNLSSATCIYWIYDYDIDDFPRKNVFQVPFLHIKCGLWINKSIYNLDILPRWL